MLSNMHQNQNVRSGNTADFPAVERGKIVQRNGGVWLGRKGRSA